MADDERPAVGTVAEEAARLLDALGGWASSAQTGYAARSAHPAAAPGDAADSTTPRCESCGAENGVGQAVTCQLCPVCQGIGLLRSVRPETVDRLADLAGALAATLRDIAGQRRADSGSSAARSQPPSARVQDIVVEDEDEDAPGSATS